MPAGENTGATYSPFCSTLFSCEIVLSLAGNKGAFVGEEVGEGNVSLNNCCAWYIEEYSFGMECCVL